MTGLYDLPLLVHELYLRGYKVRGLAHPGHWKTPLGPLFQSLGAVKASPMAAYKLLQNAEAVLLFPGGGREVSGPVYATSLEEVFVYCLSGDKQVVLVAVLIDCMLGCCMWDK